MADVIDRVDRVPEILDRLKRAIGERYTIERVLGRGGMATVFAARDRKHASRAVAIKVLRPEIAGSLGAERFLQEIRIAALLNHPHIVPVFDSGEADGLLYYVMPVVEGETLRERIQRQPPLAIDEVVRIASGVGSALSYAHAHDIVHRDIKPANIILAGDEAVVADFGIARALRAAGEDVTGTGVILGTPGYMSPEQASGSPEVDGRSDLYSLGCVMVEMIVGEPPRVWLDSESLRHGRIPDLSDIARAKMDTLPPGIEAVLARALAPLPRDRFTDATELVEGLRDRYHPRRPPPKRSVAVLPFVSLSSEDDGAFLGEGLAEEITNALARVRSIRVAARTSAFAYRDRRADIRQIGRELGVDAVLEGSVRRADETLRVMVQLVDVADGCHLWSERFERRMSDVFAIQDEITRSVVHALEVILTESERRALTRVPTSDVTAYEFYLRGRQYFHEIRRKSLEYARQMFARAIEIDPDFALAHAGVADCCSLLHAYYPSATSELERADSASRRALELDPDLPEAHAARGFALFQLRRLDEAAGEFETAIRLDPSQFEARYFYGRQCFERGLPDEAARWFEDAARVRESVEARFFAAQAFEAAGRHVEAAAAYQRALDVAKHHLELHPDDPRAATMRAVSLYRLGAGAEGLEWARRALDIDPEDAGVRYNVACLYALGGRREEALQCLEECVRLGFGNRDWIARDPDLASLRDEPRVRALLGTATGTTPPL
ncbi:MAG: protein kinase [Candidatus Eisenbacteria bacterium]